MIETARQREDRRRRAAEAAETAQDYLEYLSPKGREFVASIGAMLTELDASPARH